MHIRKCGKGGGTKLGPRYFGGGFCVDGAGVWWREAHFLKRQKKSSNIKICNNNMLLFF